MILVVLGSSMLAALAMAIDCILEIGVRARARRDSRTRRAEREAARCGASDAPGPDVVARVERAWEDAERAQAVDRAARAMEADIRRLVAVRAARARSPFDATTR